MLIHKKINASCESAFSPNGASDRPLSIGANLFNMENEIWRDIPDFEDFYQASNFGRVKSLDRFVKSSHNSKQFKAGKVLKPQITYDGYEQVLLNKNSLKLRTGVHRLVAKAFILNPQNKKTVNHIDGNKRNNSVCNLEWNTHSENEYHSYAIGLRKITEEEKVSRGYHLRVGSKSPVAKLTELQIREIRRLRKTHITLKKLGEMFNVHFSLISLIVRNRIWKHV